MVGEAVLGETNVSEKIDITRFWNWKDSDIDHMDIDSSYLNGTDYLAGKSTKDITALNMNGATAATPVTVPDLVSALVSKQTPTFDNITGLEQTASILNKATESAASGRDKAMEQSVAAAKNATDAMKAAGEYNNKQTQLSNQLKTKALEVVSDLVKNNPEALKELGLGNIGELITSSLGISNANPNGSGNTTGGDGGSPEVPPVDEPSPVKGIEQMPEPIGGGGLGDDYNDILTGKAPVLEYMGEGYDNVDEIKFNDDNIYEKFVIPGIPAVSQPNEYACWATVTTLLFYWKEVLSKGSKPLLTIEEWPNLYISLFLRGIDGINSNYFSDMYDPIIANLMKNHLRIAIDKLTFEEQKRILDDAISRGVVQVNNNDEYQACLKHIKDFYNLQEYLQPQGLKNQDQIEFFKNACNLQIEEVGDREYGAYDLLYMLKEHGPIIALVDADKGQNPLVTHYVLIIGIVIGTEDVDYIIYMDSMAKWNTDNGEKQPVGKVRIRNFNDFQTDFINAQNESIDGENLCRTNTNNSDETCHSLWSLRTQLIHF